MIGLNRERLRKAIYQALTGGKQPYGHIARIYYSKQTADLLSRFHTRDDMLLGLRIWRPMLSYLRKVKAARTLDALVHIQGTYPKLITNEPWAVDANNSKADDINKQIRRDHEEELERKEQAYWQSESDTIGYRAKKRARYLHTSTPAEDELREHWKRVGKRKREH